MITGYALAVAAAGLLTSCDDDEEQNDGPASFMIENFEQYEIPFLGMDDSEFSKGDRLTVRANGKWKFVPEDEEASSWIRIFPMEGADDGYISVFAEENTSAYKRQARFHLYINGVEQPDMLVMTQQNAQPTLTIDTKALTFKRAGGELAVNVTSNIDWEFSLTGNDASSFSAEKGEKSVIVKCPSTNTSGRELQATLVIKGSGEYASMAYEVALVQLDATFFDSFDWCNNDVGILGFKTDKPETNWRFDKWSEDYLKHGWTSISGWLWARTGFLKLGKGKYGSDVASPCIEALGSSSDVTISWKALGYGSSKNAVDEYNFYYVAILGPGKITGCSGTNATLGDYTVKYKDANGMAVNLNAARFEFDDKARFIPANDPTGIEIWQWDTSKFSIDVKGMDKTSRVIFIPGPNSIDDNFLDPDGKNCRMFLDDFKVVQN